MDYHELLSDNGPSFTSDEFKKFMQANGIKHITSALYHPSTNGFAERALQTVKQGLNRLMVILWKKNCRGFC